MNCTIEGYHSLGMQQETKPRDLCGAPVCPDHRGYHWEITHSGQRVG